MIVGIIVTIVIFLIVVYLLTWFFNDTKTLSSYANAKTSLTIPASSLDSGASVNYAYSIWFYVDDWSYKYGSEKIIFVRGGINNNYMPGVFLDSTVNNIIVRMTTSDSMPFECTIPNIPLQKWTNLIVSLNTKTIDTYINGKLVKTCVMTDIPQTDSEASMDLTPAGGFSGYTARFNYWNDAISPQQAWNVYRSGPGGNILTNLLGQYRVQLNFLKGPDVKASVTI